MTYVYVGTPLLLLLVLAFLHLRRVLLAWSKAEAERAEAERAARLARQDCERALRACRRR